jgi:hypothetical protein
MMSGTEHRGKTKRSKMINVLDSTYSFNGLPESKNKDIIEERKLFTTNNEVEKLIESLDIGVGKNEVKAQ